MTTENLIVVMVARANRAACRQLRSTSLISFLLNKPHTAEVRALETSQFHVANAATLFSQDPIAVLYVATALAQMMRCNGSRLRRPIANQSGIVFTTLQPFLEPTYDLTRYPGICASDDPEARV